jgi:hypothetical protein
VEPDRASAVLADLDELARPTAGSHQVIVDLIGATTTRTGLQVRAELDRAASPTGVKVSDAELAAVPLTRHDWHGQWNYTITGPKTHTTAA